MIWSVFILATLTPLVAGHGNMVWPPVWWDRGGFTGLKEGQHCSAGKDLTFGDALRTGVNCMWYTNYTHIPEEATLDPEYRTFPNIEPWAESYISKNPWMSPGSAPVFTPCGAVGGNPHGCPIGGAGGHGQDCGYPYGGGFSYGPKAEDLEFQDVVTTEWVAGETVPVGWGQVANHGGGYQYRLCKLPEEGKSALTEECFQQTPLTYAHDRQWVQYGYDTGSKVEFLANRTAVGTFPAGSVWTKNPIPNCAGLGGGYGDPDSTCPGGLQFPAPAAGLFGHGANIHFPTRADFQWTLMDEVVVPADLVPGDYVLSFRWDCEQTPQIWNSCSDIRIVSSSA